MQNTDNEVDGYGNPFSVHIQLFHAAAVKAALDKYEEEQRLPKPVPEQAPWKDLPAGQYEKGSGV